MTVVPLPDVPTIRIRLVYNKGVNGEGGNRLYFKYAGSAPTGDNCNTLASDVAAAWNTRMAPMTPGYWALNEVDVLDIATATGLSGLWTGNHDGSRSGTPLPDQVATNIEFGIARRYRGGKPRVFVPPGCTDDVANEGTWLPEFTNDMQTFWGDFMSDIEALSVGAVGALTHINLSYYQGFANHTNTSGRARAVPQYRTVALSDTITGYFPKTIMGSQRRRRTSTTP